MEKLSAGEAVRRARARGTVIPAYNVPYLPMLKPIAQAIADEDSIGMLQVARVEWKRFGCGSLEAVAEEYAKYKNAHTLLHLDHIPVIDEEDIAVDYLPILERGIRAGYESVMVDASRLPLAENITATNAAAQLAHAAGIPCEAELGAVMGHETETPPYEEIFRTKMGFTRTDEARRFAAESGCDWLSVAVGNIHGAVAEHLRDRKKPQARIDAAHVAELYAAAGVPLVLHGGSGIPREYVLAAVKAGIAKINVGTELRQAWEQAYAAAGDTEAARDAVYRRTGEIIRDSLAIRGTMSLLFGEK